jgi:hypothetical protein
MGVAAHPLGGGTQEQPRTPDSDTERVGQLRREIGPAVGDDADQAIGP